MLHIRSMLSTFNYPIYKGPEIKSIDHRDRISCLTLCDLDFNLCFDQTLKFKEILKLMPEFNELKDPMEIIIDYCYTSLYDYLIDALRTELVGKVHEYEILNVLKDRSCSTHNTIAFYYRRENICHMYMYLLYNWPQFSKIIHNMFVRVFERYEQELWFTKEEVLHKIILTYTYIIQFKYINAGHIEQLISLYTMNKDDALSLFSIQLQLNQVIYENKRKTDNNINNTSTHKRLKTM